jgi:putative hydrolase of the HAD superfamily
VDRGRAREREDRDVRTAGTPQLTPRAVLFDLDDTLLDYSGGADACWEAACTRVAAPAGVDPGALMAAIVETRRWFWSDPERHRRERVDMLRAWRTITVHALERCGRAADHALAGAIAELFAARRRESMRLFPDALACLEAYRRRGVPLALVTNGDKREQRDKIERHDLARFFDAIVIEGEFGAGKPDEAVYRHALAAVGTRPPDAWMIGDNLEFDVAGAERLGIHGIWIDRAGRGVPPDSPVRPPRIIRALAELD